MVPASWNNKLTDGNPVQKDKLERLPYEENVSNEKEKHCLNSEFVTVEHDGTLHLSSHIIGDDGNPENQIGGENSQTYCKTNQIKVYRRTRFKRSVTKGENLDSSEFCKDHVHSEDNIEIRDQPVISHMPLGENISSRFDCSSIQTRSSKKTNRKSKKDDFGSQRQQEEEGTKEQVGAIAPQDVNGDALLDIRPEYEPVQDTLSGSQLGTMVEAWSEEELDALWIGVRRHGQGNWEAMLKDPALKFSKFKTSQALSEMWKAERQKIIDVENFQEAGPKGITNVFRPPPISLRQSPARVTAEVSTQLHFECGPSNPLSEEDGNPTDGTSGGTCSAGMDEDDCSTTESELSFKGWIQEEETSSEGTISD